MSFREITKRMVEDGGGVAGTIMGKDGIAIQNYIRDGDVYDVEGVVIEYIKVLDEIRKATNMLKLGEVEEISIKAIDMVILFRLINADYFAALVLEPGVNIGKGRYMLRRAVTNLREEEFSS
ncbi:MAG: roadblock/LC7 domain-containing protein [Deltaproteobacteria bacterium]|nr:roadblock/LC7 domain-containing protein [Deltaproteobacteria bacterium]